MKSPSKLIAKFPLQSCATGDSVLPHGCQCVPTKSAVAVRDAGIAAPPRPPLCLPDHFSHHPIVLASGAILESPDVSGAMRDMVGAGRRRGNYSCLPSRLSR